MPCEGFKDDLLPLYYGELSDERRLEVENHLEECADCREELEKMKTALGIIRKLPREKAPEDAGREVLETINKDRPGKISWLWALATAAGILIVVAFVFVILEPKIIETAVADVEVIKRGFAVTVFNENLAMVKDRRDLANMRTGVTTIQIDDIPARIRPDSVHFKDMDDPEGTTVLEQNFEFDLAHAGKILEKYKVADPDNPESDRKITIVRKDDTEIAGALMYFSGYGQGRWGEHNIGLRLEDGSIEQVRGQEIKAVRLGALPENLRTKPTLVWELQAKKPGLHQTEVAYLTEGMSWRCDYRVTLDGTDTLSLDGWVTINNFCGVTFPDAKIKLIAGDVNIIRDKDNTIQAAVQTLKLAEKTESNAAPGFVEKAFAEYHLYTLQRPATLKSNETKQIRLMEVEGIKWHKKYKYEPNRNQHNVMVYAEFKNEEENRLGMPLPKGRVRLLALDKSGEPEIVGEDSIDHTPKDEEVKVRMGYAFDIVAEREILRRTYPSRNRIGEFHVRVKFRNHKDTDVLIDAYENLWSGYNFEVIEKTHEFEKEAANLLHFPIKVKSNTETILEYRIRYTNP
ncbi:MAG: zf-HC2 domain-containing protein [Planctomycetota bacterium]|jgi:hypothetical protein